MSPKRKIQFIVQEASKNTPESYNYGYAQALIYELMLWGFKFVVRFETWEADMNIYITRWNPNGTTTLIYNSSYWVTRYGYESKQHVKIKGE